MAKKKIKSLADIKNLAETPLEKLEGTPIENNFEDILAARAEVRFQAAVNALREWYFDKSGMEGDCVIITKEGIAATGLEVVFQDVPRTKHFS